MNLNKIMSEVEVELANARSKFPSNKHLLHAFVEEAGEVTKAFLDMNQGKCTEKDVEKEILQTITMAVRLLQEGDPDFPGSKRKFFEVWSEGYAATGESGTAIYHGKWPGNTFREACEAWIATLDEVSKKIFNSECLSFWACKLFDNETDARKNFG